MNQEWTFTRVAGDFLGLLILIAVLGLWLVTTVLTVKWVHRSFSAAGQPEWVADVLSVLTVVVLLMGGWLVVDVVWAGRAARRSLQRPKTQANE